MSPVVSVLIANFNGGTYVLDALTSAARQSLRDIEIIFIDDASTDASLAIARDFARTDDRVRVIALEANSGPSGARNAGLAPARGRWAAILDSDDFMHPDRLERMLSTDPHATPLSIYSIIPLLVPDSGVPAKDPHSRCRKRGSGARKSRRLVGR